MCHRLYDDCNILIYSLFVIKLFFFRSHMSIWPLETQLYTLLVIRASNVHMSNDKIGAKKKSTKKCIALTFPVHKYIQMQSSLGHSFRIWNINKIYKVRFVQWPRCVIQRIGTAATIPFYHINAMLLLVFFLWVRMHWSAWLAFAWWLVGWLACSLFSPQFDTQAY